MSARDVERQLGVLPETDTPMGRTVRLGLTASVVVLAGVVLLAVVSGTAAAQEATTVTVVVQPGETVAGEAIGGPPTVLVTDESGSPVGSVEVLVTVAEGPGGFASGSTIEYTDANGEIAFDDLVLDEPGTYRLEFEATSSPATPVTTDAFDVVADGAPEIASFDVSPVEGTIVQGELLVVEITNVTDVHGNPVDTTNSSRVGFSFEQPHPTYHVAYRHVEDGAVTTPITLLSEIATGNLDPGNYTDLEVTLVEDGSVNTTYDVEVVATEVPPPEIASFDVSPVEGTIVQGEPLAVEVTNVTDVHGNPVDTTSHWGVGFSFEQPHPTYQVAYRHVEDGAVTNPIHLLSGTTTENLAPGNYTDLEVTLVEDGSVNTTYDVEIVAPEVASFEASAVDDTILQGEPMAVEITDVIATHGGPLDTNGSSNVTLVLTTPYGELTSNLSVEDGVGATPITIVAGDQTKRLVPGEYTFDVWVEGDESINATYGVELVSPEVASFDVSAVEETIAQGEPFGLEIANVTDVNGDRIDTRLSFTAENRSGPSIEFYSDVNSGGERTVPRVYVIPGGATANLAPGEYTFEVWVTGDESVNATYDVEVKATTFEVESDIAGTVYDDSGLKINASWLIVEYGYAELEIDGQRIPVRVENRRIDTTVDLSNHLDPETETGTVTVELVKYSARTLSDEVRLVHEAHDLEEGYSRWSIPQPAAVYVTDGVVDVTRWNNGETTYDDVVFTVNDGSVIASGAALHEGLYVHADSADERLGFDYVTPGEAELAPGGVAWIEPGWNLLGSNYAISSGSVPLNLDLDTVSSLPATAADYRGDERMVARESGSFVRLGGEHVVGPYDTYWVYLDVDEASETRAITAAEYDPGAREDVLENGSE